MENNPNNSKKTLRDLLLENNMEKLMADDELKKILLNDDMKTVLQDAMMNHKDSKKLYKRMIKMIKDEENAKDNLFYNSQAFLNISDKFFYDKSRDRIYAFTLTKGAAKKTLAFLAAGTFACAVFLAADKNPDFIKDYIPKPIYALSEKPKNIVEKEYAGSANAAMVTYASPAAADKPAASFSSAHNNHNNQIKESSNVSYVQESFGSDFLYFVVRNDNLSKISMQLTGSMDSWKEIMRHNDLTSTLIEVNQPLRIPSHLARNKNYLSEARLVSDSDGSKNGSDGFNGTRILNKFITADKDDDFSSLSEKAFGRRDLGDLILQYNKEINPRFSSTIYDREYIFIPPQNYQGGRNG